ncbi:MAG TPA: Panacea domain-containing protein [Gaiellaceae bacterium]|nr:Panacea domain-containing protein [Gaiellaceae bacterium]
MARTREFEWQAGRFKDVVLYVTNQLADDPTFGSTKLNKILYFTDTEAYKRLGKPVTGATYQRNRHGPTAIEYPPMIRELEGEQFIEVRGEKIVDHEQERVTATGRVVPNMEQFTAEERAIIDEVIAEFRGYTNTEASDESHKRSAGWLARDQGEQIPYLDSLINPEPLDEPLAAGLKTKTPA